MAIMSMRLKTFATATLVAAAALTGLTVLPAHASTLTDTIASNANSQRGSGPCALGGYGYVNPDSPSDHSCSGGSEYQAWCADFAAWVWGKSGVPNDSAITAGANSFYDYGQKNGTWSSTPHVGDAVYFDSTLKSGVDGHVAIVTAVNSNGTFTEVGGNENGVVGPGNTFNSTPNAQVVWTNNDGHRVYVMGFASPAGSTTSTASATVYVNGHADASQNISGVINLGAVISTGTYLDYLIDGRVVVTVTNSAYPYLAQFDTHGLSAGAHQVTARTRDAAGNVLATSAPITAYVNNVYLGGHGDPTQNISGVVTMTANISAGTYLDYTVDGNVVGEITNSAPPFYFNYDTHALSGGAHQFAFKTLDANRNLIATSAPITADITNVYVNGHGEAAQTVSGTMTAGANITSGTYLDYIIDGGAAATVSNGVAPYYQSFDTHLWSNGTHQISVRTRDASGNVLVTSAPITLTVAN